MKNVTIRLSEDYVESLDEEAEDSGVSRAEYIRNLIEKGREAEETQRELEQTQAKVEDLRRQLQARNAREEDVGELVKYVEEQRQAERYRDQRRRRLDEANILRRWKWKLTGIPTED